MQNPNFSADTNSINISFPSAVQPHNNSHSPNEFSNNQPFVQPQFNQPLQYSEDSNCSEYQLQNQTGFQQWQQNNRQLNPPVNAQIYPPQEYVMSNSPTVWRRGSELIVHRYAGDLPDCCVKCGEQIGGYSGGAYIRQKFRWHNPLVYIALISPLIYCILAAVLSQRVQVQIPLCNKHLEDRKSTGKALLSGGIGAIIAIFFFSSFGYIGFSFLIFLATFIGIVFGYEYSYKPLQISKIENGYIYLKNADNKYLSRLPNC